jgi:DNA-binding LacI/PurR family transcriptional regulator
MGKTMADIAKMAGVSIGTVSRVVNNKDKVHPETRARIRTLIEHLNYQPSATARGLALRRTENIMLLVPNIGDPYFADLTKSIARFCRGAGYKVLLADCDYDPAIEAEYLQKIRDGRVDGAIISPLPTRESEQYFLDMVRHHFPHVCIEMEPRTVRTNSVLYDDAGGAEAAVDYLFEKGHKRIAFCRSSIDFQTVANRHLGYVRSHEKRGLRANPGYTLLMPSPLESKDPAPIRTLLGREDHPTAILTENDIMAIFCISTLERLGKRVPRDIAVVGFGDISYTAFLDVPLTTVRQPQEELARKAVQRLLALTGNLKERAAPPQRIIVKTKLIIRDSA